MGLASAIALSQGGWHVTVLERKHELGEEGAGLGFTANGIAALDALGLADAVRADGHVSPHAGYQDASGRWLLRNPGESAGLNEVTAVCGIHRQRLHGLLREAAEAEVAELVTGAEVTGVRPEAPCGDLARVRWRRDGEHERDCHLAVAADGIWSPVRSQLFPRARPRYSGSTPYRHRRGASGRGAVRQPDPDRVER